MDVQEDDCDKFNTSGSWPLFNELYRRGTRFKDMIETLLGDGIAYPSEIFDNQEIDKFWHEFVNGNAGSLFEISTLITFGALNRLIPISDISK